MVEMINRADPFIVVFFGYDRTLNQISCKKVKFVDDTDAVLVEYKTNELDDEGRTIVVNKPYEGMAVFSGSSSSCRSYLQMVDDEGVDLKEDIIDTAIEHLKKICNTKKRSGKRGASVKLKQTLEAQISDQRKETQRKRPRPKSTEDNKKVEKDERAKSRISELKLKEMNAYAGISLPLLSTEMTPKKKMKPSNTPSPPKTPTTETTTPEKPTPKKLTPKKTPMKSQTPKKTIQKVYTPKKLLSKKLPTNPKKKSSPKKLPPVTSTPKKPVTSSPKKPDNSTPKKQTPVTPVTSTTKKPVNSTPKKQTTVTSTPKKQTPKNPTPKKLAPSTPAQMYSQISTSTPNVVGSGMMSLLNMDNVEDEWNTYNESQQYNSSHFEQSGHFNNFEYGYNSQILSTSTSSSACQDTDIMSYFDGLPLSHKRSVAGFVQELSRTISKRIDGTAETETLTADVSLPISPVVGTSHAKNEKKIPLIKDKDNPERFASVLVDPVQLRAAEQRCLMTDKPCKYLLNKVSDLLFSRDEFKYANGVRFLDKEKQDALKEYLFAKSGKLSVPNLDQKVFREVLQNKITNARQNKTKNSFKK